MSRWYNFEWSLCKLNSIQCRSSFMIWRWQYSTLWIKSQGIQLKVMRAESRLTTILYGISLKIDSRTDIEATQQWKILLRSKNINKKKFETYERRTNLRISSWRVVWYEFFNKIWPSARSVIELEGLSPGKPFKISITVMFQVIREMEMRSTRITWSWD